MKVLHIIPSVAAIRGGPSQAVIEMVKGLLQIGVEASIVTTNDNGDKLLDVPLNDWCEYKGVPVKFFPKLSQGIPAIREFVFSASLTIWLCRNVKKYDLVHAHSIFTYPATVAMLICRWQKVPYINRPLGQLCQWSLEQSRQKKEIYLKLIEKANLNRAEYLHLTSEQEQKELKSLDWNLPNFILPHGLVLPELIPDAREKLHQILNIPLKTPTILFLSRLHPKKGLDKLIPALASLQQNFAFVLAGSGTPEYETEIDNLLEEYHLTERTHKLGFVFDLQKDLCLQGADLYILPSYSENFGIAVLESLAAGTPSLVTPGVALSLEIQKYQVGYVVPQEPAVIAEAIEKHLNLPESERKQLSQKARQFVLENYSWDKIAQELLAVYQGVLSKT